MIRVACCSLTDYVTCSGITFAACRPTTYDLCPLTMWSLDLIAMTHASCHGACLQSLWCLPQGMHTLHQAVLHTPSMLIMQCVHGRTQLRSGQQSPHRWACRLTGIFPPGPCHRGGMRTRTATARRRASCMPPQPSPCPRTLHMQTYMPACCAAARCCRIAPHPCRKTMLCISGEGS